jgi:hypothetical protein
MILEFNGIWMKRLLLNFSVYPWRLAPTVTTRGTSKRKADVKEEETNQGD